MDVMTPEKLEEAAERFAALHQPGRVVAALVAGSGITLQIPGWERHAEVDFEDIFPFPAVELPGHTPTLTVWRKGEEGLLAFNGRFHLYQGYTPAEVAAIPRLAALLGAPVFIATNASGSLDPDIGPGSLVILRDHLNLQGVNVLVGEWGRWRGDNFPDMTHTYDPGLRQMALKHAADVGFAVHEGVYAGVLGPSYETPAEVRMLAALGGTVVGMSTVQDVIAARQMRMRVLVLSLVTNLAAGLAGHPLTHTEVLEVGEAARQKLAALVERLVRDLEKRT